ncbi:iron-siderophore ABC transporter substrate-binding protein [Streptomyces sp. ATCC51928]|uniref:ABC transporter substrate-binding protein n=1 Tax=Streptomyces caviscabies TaxID=90079 RepID=A0ABW2MFC9_9ACTN|nr:MULTISPECIES: iron-siderophore ABC transporter substrate-binding protein [unclassified Streptomyces]MDX3505202.1 iron-siderophore ABC transporter substrate-binding protein [Streptomyces sp. ATCC51928]MDX5524605.1 iron-siderophore ABC transporter substrate-binding protein [Streptomyces sp. DE06-01C]
MTQRSFLPRALAAVSLTTVAALTLAACGGSDDSGSGSGSASSGGSTRTVETPMGDVQVKEAPERVVVLDTAELDSALTLGVKPVGATHADVTSGFLNYLPKDQLSGIKDVGQMMTPNLEAVAALKPDLILTSKIRHGDKYDELSKIAPTVMTENTGYPWKENFQLHAEALGKQTEAKMVTDDYANHVADVTKALGGKDKAAATEVNMVRFVEGADIRIYGKKNYIATILADVGLGRPAITDQAKDGFSYDVSPEKIDLADADVVFHSTYGDPKKSKETETTGSGLWKNMDAVKNGKVFAVDDQLWIQGIGYTAADKILGELHQNLTE